MLTYENLAIGQRVEVLQHDKIVFGTVLYKGQVVGRPGLWIGVDLATPDGDTDGSLKGRVYFRAPMYFGIFTTVDYVRLASNFTRKPRSVYRTVNKKSIIEELFGNTHPLTLPPPSTNASISNSKVQGSLTKKIERPKTSILYEEYQRYTRPNALAKSYDDKIKKQREREQERKKRLSRQFQTTQHTFSPAPSIPRVFMPPSEVDRAKRNGFDSISIPRYTVVYDQNDFIE